MGLLLSLVLLQLALCIASGTLLAHKGIWIALSSAFVVPAILLLFYVASVFAGVSQAESWARALPFVAVGMVILTIIGAIAALVSYKLKK